jgi:outer membrane protein OmpU
MKHTLLATTALVAMTGAAAADFTISGTGRIGMLSTEGTALKAGTAGAYGTITAEMKSSFDKAAAAVGTFTAETADAASITALDAGIVAKELAIAQHAGTVAALAALNADLTTLNAIRAAIFTPAKAAVAKVDDKTSAQNRMRFSFKGAGETDGGISYGVSGRFEQSNSSTAGSQFISGGFGKISMGDLDGADEVAAGGGVAGVGLTGLSDTNDIAYQSSDHNIGYEYSTAGMTFAYSQDTTVTSGSNSAMGLKYSGDVGGATVSIGVGQSKVGTSSQSTMSAAVTTGALTIKAYSSTNDNGPDTAEVTERAHVDATGVTYLAAAAKKATPDTDQTALSISYAMDAVSVTAFTKTVSTTGSADQDYSGFGFAYDMGGVTLKAGVVDNNDQQLMDFGVSFSF